MWQTEWLPLHDQSLAGRIFKHMATVQILLAVYNGALFLQEQLDSLEQQSVASVDVLVSDDGSTDQSMEILLAAQSRWTKGAFSIIHGPRKGFAKNFRHLILESNSDAEFYAFCDQDDIWLPNKLETAISHCTNTPEGTPRVYSSRTALIDKKGASIGLSPLQRKPVGFRHAILQNVTSGNTMVMNRAARQLMIDTADNIAPPLAHDHWLYMITTGCGGDFYYDRTPSILYRQHENNVIGIKNKPFWQKHSWRFNRYMTGAMRKKTTRCIAVLENCRDRLTADAQRVLDDYIIMHVSGSAVSRIKALRSAGIYRSSRIGQAGLWVDCIFKLR